MYVTLQIKHHFRAKKLIFSEILHCEVSEVSEVLWMGHFR